MFDSKNNKPQIFTEEELNELCHKWQNILGLNDWDIYVEVRKLSQMPDINVLGRNSFAIATHKSVIYILDSSDYPESPFAYDMEITLVHELLHLPINYFAQPDEDSLEQNTLEAFIEKMANVLVSQQRKIK